MNSTGDPTDDYDYQFLMIILNFIATILTLLINSHQSYQSKTFESECCGKPVIAYERKKELLPEV